MSLIGLGSQAGVTTSALKNLFQGKVTVGMTAGVRRSTVASVTVHRCIHLSRPGGTRRRKIALTNPASISWPGGTSTMR